MHARVLSCESPVPCPRAQVVEHVQQESWKERHGPGVESLQDDQLFFVDKVRAVGRAARWRLRVRAWRLSRRFALATTLHTHVCRQHKPAPAAPVS